MQDFHKRSPWGKTDRESGSHHHLAHHQMDVAAVFEALLKLPTFLERLASMSPEPLPTAMLARWAYLHDIGKLAPGFQAKGWPDRMFNGRSESHLKAGWKWLNFHQRAPELSWIMQADWLCALFSHHGRPTTISAEACVPWPALPFYDWKEASAEVLRGLNSWIPDEGGKFPSSPRAVHFCAGLLALADWIGSDTRWFKFVPDFDPDYGERARERAARALLETGLDMSWRASAPPDFLA